MNLPIECQRLRIIREELNHTQTSFAKKLGIGNTTTEYERGRTKLSGQLVLRLLSDYQINPLWLYGESDRKYLNPETVAFSPRMISVDDVGKENILMVSEKAAAGYAGNLNNPEFYEELPAFSFPLPEYRNTTFRGFQVEGFSMTPAIQPDEWIIAQAVEQISNVKNGQIYVVVDQEGIRIKQVFNNKGKQQLILHSLNTDYPVSFLPYDQIEEIWEFHSKLTRELSIANSDKLEAIHRDIKAIKEKIV